MNRLITVQKEAFPLAGLLSVVKFFGGSESGKNLSKHDIKTMQEGLSRPVLYKGERLSVITYENHHGTDLNYARNPDLAYEKLVPQSYEVSCGNTAVRPPATGHAQSKPTAPGWEVYNTPPHSDD